MKGSYEDFETGIVTALDGNNAIVELSMQPECDNCSAKVICLPDQKGKRSLTVSNNMSARVGNQVTIGESSDFLLKLSTLQYGIPFIGFILGILVLYLLNIQISGIAQEFLFFLGGICGLGISGVIAHRLAKNFAAGNQSFFSIIRIL